MKKNSKYNERKKIRGNKTSKQNENKIIHRRKGIKIKEEIEQVELK